jgi:hypothetical protein
MSTKNIIIVYGNNVSVSVPIVGPASVYSDSINNVDISLPGIQSNLTTFGVVKDASFLDSALMSDADPNNYYYDYYYAEEGYIDYIPFLVFEAGLSPLESLSSFDSYLLNLDIPMVDVVNHISILSVDSVMSPMSDLAATSDSLASNPSLSPEDAISSLDSCYAGVISPSEDYCSTQEVYSFTNILDTITDTTSFEENLESLVTTLLADITSHSEDITSVIQGVISDIVAMQEFIVISTSGMSIIQNDLICSEAGYAIKNPYFLEAYVDSTYGVIDLTNF